jgi:hypothetical protein
MVSALEALADAIQAFEGWKPNSVSYRNRNPGNLRQRAARPFSLDSQGYCVFDNLIDGYSSLLSDLRFKVNGKHPGLTLDSTLQDLMSVYAPAADSNEPEKYARFVANWMTLATGITFTPDSKLSQITASQPVMGAGIAEE